MRTFCSSRNDGSRKARSGRLKHCSAQHLDTPKLIYDRSYSKRCSMYSVQISEEYEVWKGYTKYCWTMVFRL